MNPDLEVLIARIKKLEDEVEELQLVMGQVGGYDMMEDMLHQGKLVPEDLQEYLQNET